MSAEVHKYVIMDGDSRLATRPKIPITDPPLILPNGLWESLLQLRYQHSWTRSFLSLQNSRIPSGKLPCADSQNVRPVVEMPLIKLFNASVGLYRKGSGPGIRRISSVFSPPFFAGAQILSEMEASTRNPTCAVQSWSSLGPAWLM